MFKRFKKGNKMFDISKIQKAILDKGINETAWGESLVDMLTGQSIQAKMYAHRMIGDVFLNPKINSESKQQSTLDAFGMTTLGMSVQERRRLGAIELAEVIDAD